MVLDHAPFSFFRYDHHGHLLYCNPKAGEWLGYDTADLLGKTIFDIDPMMTRENWSDLRENMAPCSSTTFETLYHHKDGTAFFVEVIIRFIKFETRAIAIAYVTKIDERKRIERELSLNRFSIDKAPAGIIRSDPDARILDVNENVCEHLAYSREELCGMHLMEIDPTLTDKRCQTLWEEMCEKGILEFETIHRRKDGTTFPVNITCNLIHFDGSRYAISILRDLTGKKKAEQQKEMIEKRLRQAQRMESLGTLASGVAHDFNNILSAISGYAELARLRCSAHSKMQQYIDQICTASIRAKNLIKQILIFSRQGESKKRDIDISIVIRETLKLIQATLPSTIEVKQCIHACLGEVFADDSQIHQIVMNLCTNAYHAMQQDGGLLEVALDRVTVGTYDSQCYPIISPGNYLKLTVSDTGVGIPADILSRIFEPYFSTKPTGEGTGMGLSAVHGIVEDHGGGIKVNSIQGVGTTVHVFLPLSAAASAPLDEYTVDASILIVDDERQLLNIGKEYLEDMGYAVVTMDNPLDAVEAVRLNPEKFDLIITDLTMPNMTGEKLAGEIRKILSDIPIILCTGFDSYCELDHLKALGIDHLLTKPINLDELDTVIHKLIR